MPLVQATKVNNHAYEEILKKLSELDAKICKVEQEQRSMFDMIKEFIYSFTTKNKWVDDTDGLEAMIEIINKSEDALHKRIPIKRYTEIKKIIYYNYMDCKVIVDILEMLENMI